MPLPAPPGGEFGALTAALNATPASGEWSGAAWVPLVTAVDTTTLPDRSGRFKRMPNRFEVFSSGGTARFDRDTATETCAPGEAVDHPSDGPIRRYR